MRYRLFDIKYCESIDGFDTTGLNREIDQQDVLDAREYFYRAGGRPHLLIALECRPRGRCVEGPPRPAPAGESGAQAPRLTPDEAERFEQLRAWRRARAEADGVPPYVIATNDQLCDIARIVPEGSQDLLAVRGFGKARVERYGQELIEALRRRVFAVATTAGKVEAGDAAAR